MIMSWKKRVRGIFVTLTEVNMHLSLLRRRSQAIFPPLSRKDCLTSQKNVRVEGYVYLD